MEVPHVVCDVGDLDADQDRYRVARDLHDGHPAVPLPLCRCSTNGHVPTKCAVTEKYMTRK